MPLTQASEVAGTTSLHDGRILLLALAGGVLVLHVVRALLVDESSALTWMRVRHLHLDERQVQQVRGYLLRLRWARVASAALLVAVTAISLWLHQAPISFLALPFLLSVVAAEALAPTPRRGRVRSTVLERRPRSYFAPVLPLALARTLLAAGILVAAFVPTRHPHALLVHAAAMLLGAVALEVALHRLTGRGLPDRQPDLSVDVAIRVASARTAVAAATVFGTMGLLWSWSLSEFPHGVVMTTVTRVAGQLVVYLVLGTAGLALHLLQPLRSWQPRSAR